jgi:membrane-bound lytic murein transglycosylase B
VSLRKTIVTIIAAIVLHQSPAFAAKPAGFDDALNQFAREMSAKHGFDQTQLSALLTEVEYQQSIIDAISRPAEGKPWHQYRPIFVNDARATEGVKFWEENQELLTRAEQSYGVPPEIIVAIIGVETRYGRHAGRYSVVDALSTLAFGYPKRAAFFRQQLEEFLLLIKEEGLSARDSLGSYAGAMGKPQFIPSSYRAYAVDFDGDGKRDLLNNNADVIGSVAAYFNRHGWTPGKPITGKAKGVTAAHQHFIDAGMKPSISIATLQQAGIVADAPAAPDALASLIRLEGESADEHWLGLDNFYVITRYNHSNLYAMAVYQLSQEILKRKRSS